jgi:Regulator of chromosome condensation (RCC1) repeat
VWAGRAGIAVVWVGRGGAEVVWAGSAGIVVVWVRNVRQGGVGVSEVRKGGFWGGAGLEGRVVSIAASKYFSVLVTDSGQVWTFGGGYNGELGHDSSWQTQARPVEGFVAQASLHLIFCVFIFLLAFIFTVLFLGIIF